MRTDADEEEIGAAQYELDQLYNVYKNNVIKLSPLWEAFSHCEDDVEDSSERAQFRLCNPKEGNYGTIFSWHSLQVQIEFNGKITTLLIAIMFG